MSELDALMSKSKEDLEAIAAQFGDYTPSVAKTKSREELIASITRMSVREVQDVMEKAAAPAKEEAPAPVAEKTEEAAPEAQKEEKKPAAKKRAPRKKKTEAKAEEAATETAEVKEKAKAEAAEA
ncbi:MAG: hypothetical protein IKP14_10040, partial [Clostridiales bacterium]|nr:hypothetical protein [Clostridiales bacterium]